MKRSPAVKNFYSRPRMGGDYSNSVSILFPLNFYSRPYVGGDPKFPAPWFNACIFLLTPPRGGDQLTLLMLTVLSISTHAPARGATRIRPSKAGK